MVLARVSAVETASNNYGPFHFPENLIPASFILNALDEKGRWRIYGKGENVAATGSMSTITRQPSNSWQPTGVSGKSYAIGGRAERRNIDVVQTICRTLDTKRPRPSGKSYLELITMVSDRPGHDRRYAIDPSRIETELGWRASETFDSGIARTIDWYLANDWWWRPIREEKYAGARLGSKGN